MPGLRAAPELKGAASWGSCIIANIEITVGLSKHLPCTRNDGHSLIFAIAALPMHFRSSLLLVRP